MIEAFTKQRELYTIDNTNRRLRVLSSWVTKRSTYITFPAFAIANVWRGASEIVREFKFALANKTSIINLFTEAPAGANFCPCIAWKPTSDTIVRYKLWEDVGEILYVPLYNGETINSDFSVEIWNTPDTTGGGPYRLSLSTLVIPSDFCDTSDIELVTTYTICTDVTFDFTDYTPNVGDYYVVNADNCGETTLIEPIDFFLSNEILVKATDNTWHYLGVLRDGGISFTYLSPASTPPAGTKEYLPLIDLNSSGVFEIRAQAYDSGGGTSYGPYIGGLIEDAAALGVAYIRADDGNYYGVSLRVNWDYTLSTQLNDAFSNIYVDQASTPAP